MLNMSGEVASKLQKVQNNAARLVTHTRKRDHITPVLMDLHWLPVKARVEFKILTTVYKCIHEQAPVYLTELLSPYKPNRALRSADKNLLCTPRFKSANFGGGAFQTLAPTMWNSLDIKIRNIDSFENFRKELKTYLFRRHFAG